MESFLDTVQRCLLMFDQFDSEGIPNDQRYNVNLIMNDISSGICHWLVSQACHRLDWTSNMLYL